MKNWGDTVGARIKSRLDEIGMTVRALSKESGVPQSTLYEIIREEQASSTELPSIAAALGLRALWLQKNVGARLEAETPTPSEAAAVAIHGFRMSLEAARLGADWDKIEDENYRMLARQLIDGFVATQKRVERASRRKGDGKRKGRDHNGTHPRE